MAAMHDQEWNHNLLSLPQHSYGGYVYPYLSRYDRYQKQYMLDNDLRTRVAICTVEEAKRQLAESSERATQRNERPSRESDPGARSASNVSGQRMSATPKQPRPMTATGDDTTWPGKSNAQSAGCGNSSMRVQRQTAVQEQEGDALGRQGRIIYKAHSGIIPNYAGYVPGQRFSYGKTWGVSTVNPLCITNQKPFQWTSLF
ncbi:uncharacterized protein LOC136754640 isoform X2 [Amia ocellicauda]|uniref:uncharacterized protein LOC136754640 isoform X2 n=1 Tax=Amia ocellicauda TaxID=2972642 RepID=UPI003464D883